MRSAHRKHRAFTLVEMLAVIFVIAILVTIVVGVSNMVIRRSRIEQTRVTMSVIMTALDKYNEVKHGYPPEATDFSDKPTSGWSDPDWQACCRGAKVYADLLAVPECQARLTSLDKNCIKTFNGKTTFKLTFTDGFEKYMDYRQPGGNGGAGGMPLLESAGPDGDFTATADNIRSDNR